MIYDCVKSILNKFGRNVNVIDQTENIQSKTTKAFIQPLRYRDKNYIGAKYMDVGVVDGTNYLYIGSSNLRLDLYPSNTQIKTDEESYVVKRAQKVCFKDDIVYIWAILQLCVEEGI